MHVCYLKCKLPMRKESTANTGKGERRKRYECKQYEMEREDVYKVTYNKIINK